MFFKNISTWSDNKLKNSYAVYTIIYYLFTLIAPAIVICIEYGLFNKAVKEKQLNGILVLLGLIIVMLGLRAFKKTVDRMPDTKIKQQRWKYTLLMLYALSIPLVIIFLLVFSKNQLQIAYRTAMISIAFFIGGIVIDYMFLRFIEKQLYFRDKVDEQEELEAIKQARYNKRNA